MDINVVWDGEAHFLRINILPDVVGIREQHLGQHLIDASDRPHCPPAERYRLFREVEDVKVEDPSDCDLW